jgi:hypothetical protein
MNHTKDEMAGIDLMDLKVRKIVFINKTPPSYWCFRENNNFGIIIF